jgi:biofilm PGA synthesis N-glycosyltransferase PgaC
MIFFASYPVVSSIVWVSTALIAFSRRERHEPAEVPVLDRYPPVTVLIPAFCEERVIANTLEWATRLDYPDYEVVVVDDASIDRTVDVSPRP